jgi:hypothetical protein
MIILPEDYKFDSFGVIGFDSIDVPQQITPRSYLQFSQVDLETGTDARSNINALSNAKRALHLQVELLAESFGIKGLSRKASQGFQNQFEFCGHCGLTTPKIVQRMNRVRNVTEHEYYFPNRSEAEDFVDVVSLFISATERFLRLFPSEIEWSSFEKTRSDLPDIWCLDFPRYEGVIYLCLPKEQLENIDRAIMKLHTEESIQVWRANAIRICAAEGDQYFKWVKFIVKSCPY